MPDQRRTPWWWAVVAAGVMVSIYTTAGDRVPSRAEVAAQDLLAPVARLFAAAGRGVARAGETFLRADDLARENQSLRARLVALEVELSRLRAAERENSRLREAVGLASRTPGRLLAAEIIGWTVSPTARVATIDRGQRDGVRPGMAVVAPGGVAGYVSQVGRRTARVLLLTDPRVATGGRLEPGGDLVLVEGRAGGLLSVRTLEEGTHLAPGDRIVTAGLGEIFPKGLPIGSVVEVVPDRYGLSEGGLVKPLVEFDRLEFLFVLAGEEGDRGEP